MNCSSSLPQLLHDLVQHVNWVYAVVWKLSDDHKFMVWDSGSYNGPPVPASLEASIPSSEEWNRRRLSRRQLLDDMLSNPFPRFDPSVLQGLSGTELFYLNTASLEFPLGTLGTPGSTVVTGLYNWVCDADNVSLLDFSRADLAKTAGIKTVLCVAIRGQRVVEIGTTDPLAEDLPTVRFVRKHFEKDIEASHHFGAQRSYNHLQRLSIPQSPASFVSSFISPLTNRSPHIYSSFLALLQGASSPLSLAEFGLDSPQFPLLQFEQSESGILRETPNEYEVAQHTVIDRSTLRDLNLEFATADGEMNTKSYPCDSDSTSKVVLDQAALFGSDPCADINLARNVHIAASLTSELPFQKSGQFPPWASSQLQGVSTQCKEHLEDFPSSRTVWSDPSKVQRSGEEENLEVDNADESGKDEAPTATPETVLVAEGLIQSLATSQEVSKDGISNPEERGTPWDRNVASAVDTSGDRLSVDLSWSSHGGLSARHERRSIEQVDEGASVPWGESNGDVTSDDVCDVSQKKNKEMRPSKRSKTGTLKVSAKNQQQNANSHCMAERKRREKLNSQFQALKGLIQPHVCTKDDKASLLGDTVEYVQELQRRLKENETAQKCASQNDAQDQRNTSYDAFEVCQDVKSEESRSKKLQKLSDLFFDGEDCANLGVADGVPQIEVRTMEDDQILIKISSKDRPGLFGDIMLALLELKINVQHASISTISGVMHDIFAAKIDASLKEQLSTQMIAANIRDALLKNLEHEQVNSPRSSKSSSESSPAFEEEEKLEGEYTSKHIS